MKKFLSILTVLLFVFGVGAVKQAFAAASISTPATANITSDSYGDGASVAVPNIVITEGAIADVKVGSIILNAPAGYKFDITSVPNIAYTGATLAGDAVVTFIGETMMQFDITAASTGAGSVTIGSVTPIKVKVTVGNPMAAAGNITMSGTIVGLDGSTNFGTLTQVPGNAHHLVVTTQNAQTESAGNGFTVTVVVKDVNNNTTTKQTDGTALGNEIIDFSTTARSIATTAPKAVTTHMPSYNGTGLDVGGYAVTIAGADISSGTFTTPANFIFYKAGTETISVTMNATAAVAGISPSITVTPDGYNYLVVSSYPTIGYIFQNLPNQIVATAKDEWGNTATGHKSAISAAMYTATDFGGVRSELTGTKTVYTSVNGLVGGDADGIATFSGLRYNTVNTTGLYLCAWMDANADGVADALEHDSVLEKGCSPLFKIYSNAGQTVTTSGTTATTTPTTTAPATTTTTTPAPAVTSMPQPAKPIAQMTQTEKNSYVMELQTFLIQLLTQLLNLMKK